ncbi:MAG: S-layer homology domain-containing protein [Defluviitaleaceae bacterium]|nr:S-layer homology domain-containing protein [Defluviitaleaceae bacterium]
MQQQMNIRGIVAIFLAVVIMIAAVTTPRLAYAAQEETEPEEYISANIPLSWEDVCIESLELTSDLYSFRLVAMNEDIAVALISQCPECPDSDAFFATSSNMIDWEIRSPSSGWYVFFNGNYYWYMNGLHSTSDWQDDWRFFPTPPDDYTGDIAGWIYTMSYVFGDFERFTEIPTLELPAYGIQRIDRLPFMIDGSIVWIGFIVDENGTRQQIRLYAQDELLNPLEDGVVSAITGLSGFSWAREAVEFIVARDLMDMYMCPDTGEYINFNASGNATRGDVLAAAVKALGLTAPRAPDMEYSAFADVETWGRGYYIDVARRLGLVTGVGNNQFAPDRGISRQDMMTMLYNIMLAQGLVEPDYELSALGQFRDVVQIAHYARLPISSLARAGIIAGDGSNLNPRRYMTRVEAAALIWNLYQNAPK